MGKHSAREPRRKRWRGLLRAPAGLPVPATEQAEEPAPPDRPAAPSRDPEDLLNAYLSGPAARDPLTRSVPAARTSDENA